MALNHWFKNLPPPPNKSPGLNGLTNEFYHTFKGRLKSVLLKLLQKSEGKGVLLNSFYEVSITLVLKPDGITTQKRESRSMSLIKLDVTIFNKILANWIQQYIKKTVHLEHLELISGMQGWFNIPKSINVIYHNNKMKMKNYMIISIDAEKASDKI